jgi:sterol 14-demethylase
MFGKDVYFLAESEEYNRQRDIVLPRFQARQMTAHLVVEVRDFIDQLDDEGEFDLIEALGPLVMRIAASCFLGPDFSERMEKFFDVFRTFSDGLDPLLPGWVPAPHLVRSHRARDRLRAAVGAVLRDRRQNPLDPADFMQELAEATYSDGKPVPDAVLISLALMLVWVGHETTAGHLSWALIDLLQHSDELARVVDEQRAVLAADEPLSFRHLHRLEHLDRAIHETGRLHPVTNGVRPRQQPHRLVVLDPRDRRHDRPGAGIPDLYRSKSASRRERADLSGPLLPDVIGAGRLPEHVPDARDGDHDVVPLRGHRAGQRPGPGPLAGRLLLDQAIHRYGPHLGIRPTDRVLRPGGLAIEW